MSAKEREAWHYRTSGVGTELTATKVAEWIVRHVLRPKRIVETLNDVVTRV